MNPQRLVWPAALVVAGIGAWIMFDALPGLNWGLWTAAAALGLVLITRARGTLDRSVVLMAATATILGIGASITATQPIDALICIGVIGFLALAMLLSVDPGLERISASFVLLAPFVAFGTALAESFTRAGDLTRSVRSERARGVVRGIIITVPIVIVFALLLSNADPIFASWRDAIAKIIETWSFIPRTVFFFALLVIVLGAYSFAAYTLATIKPPPSETSSDHRRWIGATERLILLSGVTALFWLFIIVQITYLFGNVPSVRGSGWSFADYAQHGFGEITAVATLSVILIVVTEKFGRADGSAATIKALTLAMLVSVFVLLVSAFRRVILYEDAYGFTVSRLYAQVYMIVLGVALIALAIGVMTVLDIRSLFRRVFATAALAFLVLVFWNHEAWIASTNIDRFATTGKLDAKYLGRELGPNAVPVIVERMPNLPEPQRIDLRTNLQTAYGLRQRMFANRWYEWNYRRQRAKEALATIGIIPTAD